MEQPKSKIIPVILSGGAGSRLWPTSRGLYPKQFHNLTDKNDSLLQQTLQRVTDSCFSAPLIISSEAQRFLIAEQVRQCGVEDFEIILEPEAKNTAPAIALGALYALENYDDCLILVLPSDHLIPDIKAFNAKIQIAAAAVETHKRHATFGIQPTKAETGYGYIKLGDAIDDNPDCHFVDRFVEKPDLENAKLYLEDGRYLWNSGIFLFNARTFIKELHKFEPQVLAACKTSMEKAKKDADFLRPDPESFAQSPSISVDYAIMERSSSALVVPCAFSWSDVGSWSAIWDISPKDNEGNVITGDVFVDDVHNSLLRSEGPIIGALGLDNIIVVATADAVLVADQDKVQDVKKIVDQLSKANRTEHLIHEEILEPWGSRFQMDTGPQYEISRLTIASAQQAIRTADPASDTLWIILSGSGQITVDTKTETLLPGQTIQAQAGKPHTLSNCGESALQVIELRRI